MLPRTFFALLLLSLLSTTSLSAQESFRIGPGVTLGDTSQLHQLVLVNFTRILGLAVDIDGNELVFQLRAAEQPSRFPLDEIRFLGLLEGKDKENAVQREWAAGPLLSDLSYFRTALPNEGKGRVRVLDLIYSVAEFNLGRNAQLGTGLITPVGPLFTQRFRAPLGEFVNIGLSNQMVVVIIDEFTPTFLLGELSGNLTVGSEKRFLNFGVGLGYDTDAATTINTIRLSGGGRIGEEWHLYGELGLYNSEFETTVFPAISAAYSRRRHRWRFGVFVGLVEDFGTPPLPLVGYEYFW